MSIEEQPSPQPRATATSSDGAVADHIAIERLIYRYAIAIDFLDTAALKSCFSPGAVLVRPGDLPDREGDFAGDVIEQHRQGAECTMHNVLNHMHSIQGLRAHGLTYGIATWIVMGADGQRIKRDLYMRYYDDLVKQGALWLFLKRRLELLFTTEVAMKSFGAPVRSGQAPTG